MSELQQSIDPADKNGPVILVVRDYAQARAFAEEHLGLAKDSFDGRFTSVTTDDDLDRVRDTEPTTPVYVLDESNIVDEQWAQARRVWHMILKRGHPIRTLGLSSSVASAS